MTPFASQPGDVDNLLRPTLGDTPPAVLEKPWRISSAFWVAFLGGILPVTVIACLNAGRLRMPSSQRATMAVIGVLATAALLPLWMRLPPADDLLGFVSGGRDIRLYSRMAAVAVYLVFARMQKRFDAEYQVFSGGEYASLWKPGVTAAIVAGTAQTVLLASIAWVAG